MVIRAETPNDVAAIRLVNRPAFGREDEGALVDALRRRGRSSARWWPKTRGRWSAMSSTARPRSTMTAALRQWPRWSVAVLPDQQRRGIGDALIRAGLDVCREQGYGLVIVLGHSTYYPRFGFRPSRPLGIRWEHDAPEAAFMVMELRPGALAGRGGWCAIGRSSWDEGCLLTKRFGEGGVLSAVFSPVCNASSSPARSSAQNSGVDREAGAESAANEALFIRRHGLVPALIQAIPDCFLFQHQEDDVLLHTGAPVDAQLFVEIRRPRWSRRSRPQARARRGDNCPRSLSVPR